MKSTRQKGQDFQRWVKKILEDWGWTVHNQGLNHRQIFDRKTHELIYVSQSQDIFGCIDLICKKPEHKTLWIQATEDTGRAKKEAAMTQVPWSELDDVQIWMKREDGHVDIFQRKVEPVTPEFEITFYKADFPLLGKIIRRKFFASAGCRWEF
jgi:hypothetical protein